MGEVVGWIRSRCGSSVGDTLQAVFKLEDVYLVSGVATYGELGYTAPSNFGNSVHSAAAAGLTVKICKITKEKHVLHFYSSPQKQAKTHVNRLKQSCNTKEIPGRDGEEKN